MTANTISTNTLTADNLLALIAKLPGTYAGGAKFAMSTATLFGSIYPLKDGDGAYLFTDAESAACAGCSASRWCWMTTFLRVRCCSVTSAITA